MKKDLYRVKVILYVMAENESEARLAATKASFDIFECTAKKAEHLEAGWDTAIPYNSDDERTCAEIFGSQRHAIQLDHSNSNQHRATTARHPSGQTRLNSTSALASPS